MKLRSKDIYAVFDDLGGSLLVAAGFGRLQPGEYLRDTEGGQDRVLVDGDASKGRFAVMLSYYPNDFSEVEDLYGHMKPEPRGFPCGPYLNGVGVGSREYWWPSKPLDLLQRSVARAKDALESHGLPWLEALRDPKRFAVEVDEVAALYAAFAHERSGELERARELYQEARRRQLAALNLGLSEEEYVKSFGREYLFVANKLGIVDELSQRLALVLK